MFGEKVHPRNVCFEGQKPVLYDAHVRVIFFTIENISVVNPNIFYLDSDPDIHPYLDPESNLFTEFIINFFVQFVYSENLF